MMIAIRTLPTLLSILTLFLISCSESESEPEEREIKKKTTGNSDKSEEVKAKGKWSYLEKTDWHWEREIASPALDAIWAGDFEKLEKMAEKYRSEKTLRNNGGWALSTFYSAFDSYDDWNQRDAERYYPKLEKKLLEWQEKFPDSPTPHVALSGFYSGYAWFARGGGYSGTVTEEGWKLFRERLEKSAEVAEKNKEIAQKAPYFFRVLLRIGLGMGWPIENIDAVVEECRTVDPDFWSIYDGAAYHLLPRWYGKSHKDWHNWLVKALDESKLPAEKKDEFYAQVVLRKLGFAYSAPDTPNIFEVSGVDWDRLNRGGEILIKKFPQAGRMPSRYLRSAAEAGEFEVARSIVKRMNFVFAGRAWWGKEAAEFYGLLEFLEKDAEKSKKQPKQPK